MKIARGRTGRRGLATMTVIGAMIFLGMAVVGMAALFAHEARRTRATLAQTQLRQLLLAGVPMAQAELKTGGTAARDVAVAVPVEGAVMTLHIREGRRVEVAASYRGFKGSQALEFSENLALTKAELGQTGGN